MDSNVKIGARTYLLHDVAKEAPQLGAPGTGGDGSVGLLEVVVEGGFGLRLVALLHLLLLEGLLLDVVVCEVHGCGGRCCNGGDGG